MDTLRLTKGIGLVIDRRDGRVWVGQPTRCDLTQVPVKLWVTLEGTCDSETGLLVNVRDIKQAFVQMLAEQPFTDLTALGLFSWARRVIKRNFSNFKMLSLSLDMTDALTIAWRDEDLEMIQITTKYELAASHCLHNADWTDEQNELAFGKCSNPAGHGHNYLLEVTLRGNPDRTSGEVTDLEEFRRVVQCEVLDRFDHKNLNEDCEEFAGLMPTVENMAKVFWDRLIHRFTDVELYRVAVWETPTTYAEYFGPGAGPLRWSSRL
ncbi:MAG: 6-carboxytetrahydropterin synthase [Sedimentisphaerales bacterium]|nr:6-carboxytetrahydropterin synthase [Sedimentisphaerales bacterium]